MKKILFAILWLVPSLSFACNIQHTSGLSDAQVQALKVQCEQMKLKAKQDATASQAKEIVNNVTTEDISKWSTLAQELAKALGVAAKEIGISVNEFIKTPAGWLVVAIVLWTFLISDITMIALCALSIWFLIRRLRLSKVTGYDIREVPTMFGMQRTVKTPIYKDDISEGDAWVLGISAFVTIVMMIVTMANVG